MHPEHLERSLSMFAGGGLNQTWHVSGWSICGCISPTCISFQILHSRLVLSRRGRNIQSKHLVRAANQMFRLNVMQTLRQVDSYGIPNAWMEESSHKH